MAIDVMHDHARYDPHDRDAIITLLQGYGCDWNVALFSSRTMTVCSCYGFGGRFIELDDACWHCKRVALEQFLHDTFGPEPIVQGPPWIEQKGPG